MPTQRFSPPRSGRSTETVPELVQHQRWLDDGGAAASDSHQPLPVMWSPVALSAATVKLRDLADRLHLHRIAEESRRGTREWQLGRLRTH